MKKGATPEGGPMHQRDGCQREVCVERREVRIWERAATRDALEEERREPPD